MDRPGLHSGPSLERIPLPVVLVDTTKEGFLFIRKHNGEWKKYWFVLGRTALCYYRREKELRPVGQIAMDNVTLECRVNEWATKSAAYCFQITHPERPTTFLASATLTERARLMQKPEAPPAPPKLDLERAGFKDDDSTETDTEDEREEDDDPATLASALSAAILASPPTSPRIEMAPPLLGSVDSNTSVTSSSSSLSTASSLSSAASAGAPGVGAAQLASAFSLATQAASSAGPAPALFSSAQAAKLHRPRTFSFTGEKLIVAYRYMKQGLTGQTSPPSVIYIPSNNIYRRFTFNVAIQKLLKSYPSLNTLNITDCKFGGDFELEYIEICQKNPSLTNLEFRNTSGKRNVHDSLFSVVSKLPIHIRSLTLDNILSKVLQTRQQITSIDLSNNPFYTPQMTVLIKCLSSTYLEHINLTGCSVSDEQACLLFAARTKRKGIIVLEEASIRLGSVHGMMAKYAFEVVTPNRIWILCCDSAEDMDAWVDAIQKVKEVQANKVLKSQLEEIKNGVAAFAGVYDTYNIKYPDPHRKWILQWWFPQCLEVLAFSILGEKQEAAAAVEGTGNGTNSGREKLSASTSSLESSLSREGKTSLSSSSSRLSSGRRERNFIDKLINQFVVNSGIAFYLLTGDYLFDDEMVRSVDGVFQPSLTLANHYKHIQFQHENMQRLQHLKSAVHESLRSSVAKGPFDQQSVNALMQSYSAFKSAQSPETPHK
ncbi:uncharacterized protein ACA1_300520, partial [Acanthamoeba castellanii str. Neff]